MISHVEGAVLVDDAERVGGPGIDAVVRELRRCVARVAVVRASSETTRAPLLQVHAALVRCEAAAVLVVGTPHFARSADEMLALLALAPTSGPRVVAPATAGGPEVLFAVYRKSLLAELDRARAEGRHSSSDLGALVERAEPLLVPREALLREGAQP